MSELSGSEEPTQPVTRDWSHVDGRRHLQRRPFGRLGTRGASTLAAVLFIAVGLIAAYTWPAKAPVPDYYRNPNDFSRGAHMNCGSLLVPQHKLYGSDDWDFSFPFSWFSDPGSVPVNWKPNATIRQICGPARRPIYIFEVFIGLSALALLAAGRILRKNQTLDVPVPRDKTTVADTNLTRAPSQNPAFLGEASDLSESEDSAQRIRYPWLS